MANDRLLVELQFRIDTAPWARQLAGFASQVLPYAANYALTGTVYAAVDALIP